MTNVAGDKVHCLNQHTYPVHEICDFYHFNALRNLTDQIFLKYLQRICLSLALTLTFSHGLLLMDEIRSISLAGDVNKI